MKTLWFVLVVAVAAALTVGGVLAVVLMSEPPLGASLWLAIVAITVFVCGPVCLAGVQIYWDFTEADSRRYFHGYLRAVLVLEALAAAAIVVYALLEGTGPWVPITFIGVGGALTALVVYAGPKIVAKYRKPRARVEWAPVTRAETVRGVRTVALWFVGTLVLLGLILAIALPGKTVESIAVSLQWASIAGGVASVFVATRFSHRLAAVTGGDPGLSWRITQVVVRGRKVELDEADTAAAARYAAVWQVVQPFQTAFIGLVFLSSAASQAGALASGSTSGLSFYLLVGLAAAFFVVGPLLGLQVRRARRYAREHAHLLPVAAAAGYDREQSPRR